MAYVPTEWETGDVITAALLNKMENGIAANSKYIVETTLEESSLICNKTWAEISEAFEAGMYVVIIDGSGFDCPVNAVQEIPGDNPVYLVYAIMGDLSGFSSLAFVATADDDYPQYTPN